MHRSLFLFLLLLLCHLQLLRASTLFEFFSFPYAVEFLPVCPDQQTRPMLPAVFPATLEDLAIAPVVLSVAMFLTFAVLPFVNIAVGPCKSTSSMHLVVLPGSFIDIAIVQYHDSHSVHFVADEITHENYPVSPPEGATSMLHSIKVHAIIAVPILPCLNCEPILPVVVPLSNENSPVYGVFPANSLSHALEPLAAVVVSIAVDQSPSVMEAIHHPVPIIPRAIRPHLRAFPVTQATS